MCIINDMLKQDGVKKMFEYHGWLSTFETVDAITMKL